ncbi:hypothetical protein L1987_16331 [Smallanthus sonchifolius]|uniref:Uncharacterized protein n=1 Tax=Smallanthus sonchifolius TaxID=185202 RepID=A0ACB9J9K9_9ASTR|nr:hypothetical protein L1987_16331 [Smallanthus sonchifolius]
MGSAGGEGLFSAECFDFQLMHTRSKWSLPKPEKENNFPLTDFAPEVSTFSSPPSSPPPFRVDQMADRQTVHQQSTLGFTGVNSPITIPPIANENLWQIPSYIMTAISNTCQFHGRDDEDAPAHIARLTRILGTFQLQGTTNDAIFLQLFPFTLADRAATWLDSQPAGTHTTWATLRDGFLKKYFPPAKASRLRDQIHSFRMEPDESYYLAWERFKNLLARCSQHGLSDWALVEKFYNGLNYDTKARFDTSAGGHLMGKKSVTLDTSVAAALENLHREMKEIKAKVDKCEFCRGGHSTLHCPLMSEEQVDFIAGQFSSGSSGGQGQFGNQFNNQEVSLTTRDRLVVKDQVTQKTLSEHDILLKNQQSAFLDLQRSVGDMARKLEERLPGQFPGGTQLNPNAHAKAITTRSGRILGEPKVREGEGVEVEEEEPVDKEIELKAPGKVQSRLDPAITAHTVEPQVERSVEKRPVESRPSPVIDLSRIPYPARLKQQKYAKEYEHFLDMFKQLKINLPFIEALQCMPKYAKFLKDLLKRKDRLGELSNIPLTGGCSAVVLNKLPEKLMDPGIFTIPCLFGSDTQCRALADLGASINLMSFSLYEKLDLGELSPTRMTLSLADRSVKYPRGIIENLLVKVDKFVFPVDFVILDMEADEGVPIILGRPFLRTTKALIDVYDGKISLCVGDEKVTFEVARSMQHPNDSSDFSGPCHSVYFLNSFMSGVDQCLEYISGVDLLGGGVLDELEESEEEEEETLWFPEVMELSEVRNESERASLEILTPLELKVLPSHLEYAYLGEGSSLPVIISSKLMEEEKLRLLEVLKLHKEAIAWSLSDIKGISPAYCTHRILMEDKYKPVVQPQRRLNPNMQEVVKKEVLKLLDIGVIYPISDSPWVSPTQVVPKKGGMTVVMNEKNELIPSRTIPIAPEDQDKTTFTCPYGTYAYRRMPFGLCNAPATFQRCMVAIFQDMIETSMEVFMDDFSVYGGSFDQCLINLGKMLKRCTETKLMLNWEKCHFMVTEGIVLGHKISRDGIEVDRAKIDTISRLPPPTSVRSIRNFLGHAGFYRRFIKDFSKITRPMTRLLEKDAPFVFDEECLEAFEFLKEKLISAPILISPEWSLPFELMCDASDYAVGAVLGQRRDKHFHHIYYASKTLNDAQENYTTTEKELLAVVFAFDKFRSYLVLSKTTVFTDHSALRFLFQKKDAKPRLIRWILLLSEFDIEIKDKRGVENVAADHLSRLEDPKREEIREEAIGDKFPHESVEFVAAEKEGMSWFSDLANYLANGVVLKGMTTQQWKKFFRDARSGNRYILVAIDYVSKWVEAQALPTNDGRVVVRFLKKLFTCFGTPRALISDRGTHFCNAVMEKALARYGATHHLSTAYHPQTSGQVENANRGVKRILEKTVRKNRKDWSEKLDDALWAFRTAYKTPLGTTPFMVVYGKACHLPVELEHRALWALKTVNLDLTEAARKRFFQIHELEELRDAAYARSWNIKEKTKALHDRRLRRVREFRKGDKVLVYNSRLKLFGGKLKSKWSGPYVVKEVFPYGTIELLDEADGNTWKVNGHRLKHYVGGPINLTEVEETPLEIPPNNAQV